MIFADKIHNIKEAVSKLPLFLVRFCNFPLFSDSEEI